MQLIRIVRRPHTLTLALALTQLTRPRTASMESAEAMGAAAPGWEATHAFTCSTEPKWRRVPPWASSIWRVLSVQRVRVRVRVGVRARGEGEDGGGREGEGEGQAQRQWRPGPKT